MAFSPQRVWVSLLEGKADYEMVTRWEKDGEQEIREPINCCVWIWWLDCQNQQNLFLTVWNRKWRSRENDLNLTLRTSLAANRDQAGSVKTTSCSVNWNTHKNESTWNSTLHWPQLIKSDPRVSFHNDRKRLRWTEGFRATGSYPKRLIWFPLPQEKSIALITLMGRYSPFHRLTMF